MGIKSSIGKLASKVASKFGASPQYIRAKYDAAQTSSQNIEHWANADNLSANAANSSGVRQILRSRSRYEVSNNSIARGIINTLADDVVGTGPRLQMQIPGAKELNAEIEAAWHEWAEAIGLDSKLRTMRISRAQDGEIFAIMTNNPRIPTPVTLDIRLLEGERVATDSMLPIENDVDGILFDTFGNPISYNVLRQDPNGLHNISFTNESDTVEAKAMIHWFRPDRPGQARGVPEITSALPLFAYGRRYTLATVAAAESAANFAAILKSNLPPNVEFDEAVEFEEFPLSRNMITTVPMGYSLEQLKAEQPTATYAEFKKELIAEIARCLSMPYNIAAGDSSNSNFASGQLDFQTYMKSIECDRASMVREVLNRIFAEWIAEAVLRGMFGAELAALGSKFPHMWYFDNREVVDVMKAAKATTLALENGTTTLAIEYAKQGKDWEPNMAQRARELEEWNKMKPKEPETTPEASRNG